VSATERYLENLASHIGYALQRMTRHERAGFQLSASLESTVARQLLDEYETLSEPYTDHSPSSRYAHWILQSRRELVGGYYHAADIADRIADALNAACKTADLAEDPQLPKLMRELAT